MNRKIKKKLAERFSNLRTFSQKLKAKKWPKGSIVYYTGNRKKPFVPELLKTGVTGTELALFSLTKYWVQLGYQVTVYTSCQGKEGNYDGVEYVNHYDLNWEDTFDILIILSHPYILNHSVKARKICWDWHDVLGSERTYPPDKIKRFDLVFAKSNYQRSLIDFLPDEKFAIYPNGTNSTFEQYYDNPKQPYKLIYSSRYYRGLDSMLTYGWPIIKQEIPDAELHIYHGWCAVEEQPGKAEWKQNMIALFEQDGVSEHGRVGQDDLMQEKSTASIHYYGCTYKEIDCISIRESAVVGCVPVTTDFAVFQEKKYCERVPLVGEPTSKESQEALAYRIVDLLRNPQELAMLRQKFHGIAKQETWENIAKCWAKEF